MSMTGPPPSVAASAGERDRLRGLARAARGAGRHAESLRHLREALPHAPQDPWSFLEIAHDLGSLGAFEAAEDAIAAAERLAPQLVNVHFARGRIARLRGRRGEALAAHRAAAAAAPRNPWAHLEMAADLLATGAAAEADAAYGAALAIDGGNVQALLGRGKCARASGGRAASLAVHLQAATAAPRNPWPSIEAAADLLALGRADEAGAHYEAALAIEPGNVQALLGRAAASRATGDQAAAIAWNRRATEAAPANMWAHLGLGAALREIGRFDEAQAAARAAQAVAPGAPEPLLALCQCARAAGRRAEALAHAQAAHAAAPARAAPLIEMAAEHRAAGRFAVAAACLDRVLAAEPDQIDALLGRGQLARLAGDRVEALAAFERAVAAHPGAARAHGELAGELRQMGRFEAAEAALRAALGPDEAAAAGRDLHLLLELGQVGRARGDHAAAFEAFARAAAAHPGRAQPLLEMASAARALGRTEEAAALLARAAALEPESAAVSVRQAEHAMACGTPAEALAAFEHAVSLRPGDVGAALGAVEALAVLGETATAMTRLTALRAAHPEAAAAILQKQTSLLRRTGDRAAGRALLSGQAGAPPGFGLAVERLLLERASGSEAAVDRALGAIPARTPAEIAQVLRLEGEWAEERGDGDAALERYRRAESLDPVNAQVQQDLCRLAMHRLDLDAASRHLGRFAALTAGAARARGRAVHPSQTHYGQVLDELRLDEATGELRALLALAPAARVEGVLDVVRRFPESTGAALTLMLTLRALPEPVAMADAAAADGTSPIPRRITQFWTDATPPPDIAGYVESWRALHPGWRHALVDEGAARAFVGLRHGAGAWAALGRAEEPAQKADLFRLGLLVAEGGVYVDADDRAIAPIGGLLRGGARLVCYQEDFGTIGNNVLAAVPGHPVLQAAHAEAQAALARVDRDILWLSTGPGLITRALAGWLAEAGSGWRSRLGEVRILRRRELFRTVAVHCHAGYKATRRHWGNSAFRGAQFSLAGDTRGRIERSEAKELASRSA